MVSLIIYDEIDQVPTKSFLELSNENELIKLVGKMNSF